MEKKRVAFHHFGCKVNFSEASSISRDFSEHGYTVVDHHEQADLYVISSCMVTSVAEKKCRAAIRQVQKSNPDAKIAVIGCFSELKPEEISRMEGVNLVLGNSDKFNLLQEVENKLFHNNAEVPAPPVFSGSPFHPSASPSEPGSGFHPSWSIGDRTRSFLKIQDGCDYFCAYCTIPFARGRSRSDTIQHILQEIAEISSKGVKEIILTGINIGDFGRHQGETLEQLLQELTSLPMPPRFRISSIEPDLFTDGIISLVAENNSLMPHFHLPLQSGSDKILKAMKRRYSTSLFAGRVSRIASLLPMACIAVDVITGFPGETEEDFIRSYDFISGLPISYLHVFSYSPRDNTLANNYEEKVDNHAKKRRSEALHLLSDQKKEAFYRKNTGRTARVLFESDITGGFISGFTENYIKVRAPFQTGLVNTVREVTLPDPDPGFIFTLKSVQ